MKKQGAHISKEGACTFSVWAPEKDGMLLHIVHPSDKEYNMIKDDEGIFSVTVQNVRNGCRYFFRPDGENDLPDPASHYQPEGVHGPSQVVDHSEYIWNDDNRKGIPFKDLIIYEIHTGTFTPDGTFEAIIPRLDDLKSIGINAIELMPVSQFPGSRNWGYDGVFPYAVQNSYGGPSGLKKLVDACHCMGMIIFLDVVYNHLGPEGNYFGAYAPYFTGKYRVPWGDAVNFDEAWSDGVREYFSENPVHWAENYHMDGIRIDAIHMMFDDSAIHFWELVNQKVEITEQVHGHKFYRIAECDYNSPKITKTPETGGYGFDAQWLDDFHHALYVLIHPEGQDRYEDFGRVEQLAKAYKDGFVHSGEFVRFRKRRHGASSAGIPGERFVVFNQNHDQIGNRVRGERLSALVGDDRQKLATAALLLSPYIPMLFMGEEYGEDNPFYYFISHTDKDLVMSVREGRKKEFENYKWDTEPPDVQDVSTYNDSKPDWSKRNKGKYALMLEWTSELIKLRKNSTALGNTDKNGLFVYVEKTGGLTLLRWSRDEKVYLACFLNFSEKNMFFNIPSHSSSWKRLLYSGEGRWGSGNDGNHIPERINANDKVEVMPWSVAVYGNNEKN
jgi:maltooligosyltrehalose trehalohydrolase